MSHEVKIEQSKVSDLPDDHHLDDPARVDLPHDGLDIGAFRHREDRCVDPAAELSLPLVDDGRGNDDEAAATVVGPAGHTIARQAGLLEDRSKKVHAHAGFAQACPNDEQNLTKNSRDLTKQSGKWRTHVVSEDSADIANVPAPRNADVIN